MKKSREVIKMIFQVTSTIYKLARAPDGDHVDENHQTRKQYYQNKHGNVVEIEEPRDSPNPSNKAC